jgi:molybdate-binding protein
VAANGDVAVFALLRLVNDLGAPLLGFVQADRTRGLAWLAGDAVLAAGAHAGVFPGEVGGERIARVHLVDREVGLLFRKDTRPPRLRDLPRLRLASRPPSAGVRHLLDEALRLEKVDPARAHRGASLHESHLDVALAVSSGQADVGLGSRAWGDRAGLSFQAIARESYGLLVKARDLGDPRVVRVCEVAQGPRFRETVAAVAGYDPRGAGDIRYDG